MKKRNGILVLLMAMVFLAGIAVFDQTASAKIYKWEDESGVHYTDDYYKIPLKYRPDREPKPEPMAPFPTMMEEEEIQVEETDLLPEEEIKPEEEEPLLSEEAKSTIQNAIDFLAKDIQRYKPFYDLKSGRGNTKRLKETLLGTLEERKTLAENLTEIEADATRATAGFLMSTVSRDEAFKGKKGRIGVGSGPLWHLMLDPVKTEEDKKGTLLQKLKEVLEEDEKKAKEKEAGESSENSSGPENPEQN